MKTCLKCKQTLSLDNYYYNKRFKNWQTYCKECNKKLTVDGRKVIGSKAWWGRKYHNTKHRAKERGLVFEISKEEYKELLLNDECHYCKIKLGLDKFEKTVDRIDSNLGYTKDNLVLSCSKCNKIKSNFITYEQMTRLGKFLSENRDIKIYRNFK